MTQTSKIVTLDNRPEINRETSSNDDKLLDFVAIMVHDLQGPFVSMKTILKLLNNSRFDLNNKNHRELLNSSIIAFERAESIIYDLIDAAKAGNVGFPVELEFTKMNGLVANSASMLKASAVEYGVEIVLKTSSEVKAQVDKDLFLRVIDNLLFNSLKHSVRGGKIYAEIKEVGDFVEVVVSDEGSGFEGINTDDLFDKYKQVDLRKKGKYKGVGLGLFFCRLAIEAMGGKIRAENNSEGGASFIISLIKDRRRG